MTKQTIMAFAVAAALAGGTAVAGYMDFELDFSLTDYTTTEVEGDDEETYLVIEVDGGETYGPPGEPLIARIAYDAIVPFGSTDVSAEIRDPVYFDEEDAAYLLYPGQEPKGTETVWEWTDPGPVYEVDAFYPGDELDGYGKGLWRGHFASQCLVAAVEYNPVDEVYKKLDTATLRVNYTPPGSPPSAERWEWEHVYDRWSDFLKTFVLNPDDVYDNREPVNFVDTIAYDEYEEGGYTVKVASNQESEFYSAYVPDPDTTAWPHDDPTPFAYQYIIITNDYARHETGDPEYINLTAKLSKLVDWKTEKGVPVVYKTVDDIKIEYAQEGNEYWDWQVAIRNFLKDAAKNWGPEYIIFIGDVDHYTGTDASDWGKYGVVPIRAVVWQNYRYEPPQYENVPDGWTKVASSDIYYTDLDEPGDWDGDGDGIFGEPGTAAEYGDNIQAIKPDVACGWVPASNQDEVEDYIDKVVKYEKNPDLTKTNGCMYMTRFLHIAADDALNPNGHARENPDYVKGFDKTYMYEGTGVSPPSWPPDGHPTYPQPHDINDALDDPGYGLVEIDTHGHPFFHYILTQGNDLANTQVWASHRGRTDGERINNMVFPDTVEDLYNDYYSIMVSLSCKTNCFEYDGKTEAEIVSERYLFDDDGGGVAYIGNTRDGYWSWSAVLTRYFYKVLFSETASTDDDNYFLGPAVTWGREIFSAAHNHERKCHDRFMLSGDPELNVWTADPGELALDVTVEDAGGGDYKIKVTVKDKNNPSTKIKWADVCLHAPAEAYLLNVSNDIGRCDFVVPEGTSGKITATKHNWVPAQTTFVAE